MDEAAELAAARADPRRRFAHYVVLSELGRGGMGVVYRAWDERLKRMVALKTLLGDGAPMDTVARFRREAEAVARLRHPAIVQVYDVGSVAGRHYLAMEFVPGKTLAARLRPPDRIPLVRALEALRDVARALHHAHEHGIIHRDVKPQNVIIDEQGKPHVLDFGVAKVSTGAPSITVAGTMIGTPAYMPPEQTGGEDSHVDARSDVYSLGATLYHVLTGKPPFEGPTNLDVVVAVVSKEPVPPGALNPRAAGDLETICLACLEKEPARRYASAAALADDLDRYLAGEPIAARPSSTATRTLRWARRRKLPVALAALLVLTLAGSAAWVGRAREEAARAARESELAKARAELTRAREELARERKLPATDQDRAAADRRIGLGLRALQAADRLRSLAGPTDAVSREETVAVALELAVEASRWQQWSVAAAALDAAASASPDSPRVSSARLALVDSRTDAARERRRRVDETLADARRFDPGFDHEDALFTLVRLADADTTAVLESALAAVCDQLEAARRDLYLSAVEPTREEAARGEGRIEGLAAAMERAARLAPLEVLRAKPDPDVERAQARLRARHAPASSSAASAVRTVLLRAEERRLGAGGRALERLLIEALGRIGSRSSVPVLARCLVVETEDRFGTHLGVALVRIGGPEAEALLAEACALAGNGPFGLAVSRTYERLRGRRSPGASGPQASQPTAGDDPIRRAEYLAQTGDLDGALALATALIEKDPGDARAHSIRGVVRVRRGQHAEARADLTRALELDPNLGEAYVARAFAARALGDDDSAKRDLDRAVEVDPKAPQAWLDRAILLRDRGEVALGVADAERACRLAPDLALAWGVCAELRRGTNDLDKALAEATRALELDPDLVVARLTRGFVYQLRGRLEDALLDLERAVELDERNPHARTFRGIVYAKRKEYERALDDFDRAIALDPRLALAYRNRAIIRRMKGDRAGAIADIERFLELAPATHETAKVRAVLDELRREESGAK